MKALQEKPKKVPTPVKHYFIRAAVEKPRFSNDDARVIGPVLGQLADQGEVAATTIVEAAQSTNSPLHAYFEWDNQKAAQAHRLETARQMITTVRVRIVSTSGSVIGSAAQRITVKASEPLPTLPSTVSARVPAFNDDFNSFDDSENARLTKRSLDKDYYPETLDEACDIIDNLRDMLGASLEITDMDGQDIGMSPKEAQLYRFLKSKRSPVTKQNIMSVLYGLDDDTPEIKIVDVFVCKLRKKLPAGEKIETIWGSGYQFVQLDP